MGYSSICSKFHEKIRMPNLNLPSNSQCIAGKLIICKIKKEGSIIINYRTCVKYRKE